MRKKKMKLELIVVFGVALFFLMFINSTSSAQVAELPPLKIVHLGDSFSAGNGARSSTGQRNYAGVEGCFRSPTNWGSQFAASLSDTFHVQYINRACSGGVLNQITNPRNMEDYDWKENGECPAPDYPDEELFLDAGPSECERWIRPQIDGIDTSTDIVLMTIGGNDLDFDQMVLQCFVAGFRTALDCENVASTATTNLIDYQEDLEDTFAEIRERLRPGAKVVLVSYPHLLLDKEYVLPNGFDAGTTIRALAELGDAYQVAAMHAANTAAGEEYVVYYDGTKTLFAGHEPDPSIYTRNEEGWIHEFEGDILSPRLSMKEWYHPNSDGHENWGRALSILETFGAAGGIFNDEDTNANIDVAFVVDTTGSMGDEIAQVQADLSTLVNQLATTTESYRVGIISYRDFSERTGNPTDYPARVDQTFTDDLDLIQTAIDSLTAEEGGDWEESVLSGIQTAIELPWRTGVTKVAIVIGDAPALLPDPITGLTIEPITGYTVPQIIANSIAVDPVQVIGVDVGDLNYGDAIGEIADGTGGGIVYSYSDLTTTLSEIFDQTIKQPFAWIGQAYSGEIGQPVQFSALGSYDPSGSPLTLYEWDFDGDGVFDLETTEATATHVYDTDFNDYVVMRVTGVGGTALASARTVVNIEGYALQGDEALCELDEDGYSIIFDEEKGSFLSCTADSLPEFDQEKGGSLVDALAYLENAIDGLSPKAFRNKYNVIVKAIERDNVASACGSLQGMSGLAEAQAGKKITEVEAATVIEAVEALEDILGCSNK